MNLKVISPTLHGLLDYTAALGLVLLPMLLSLKQESALVYWFSIAAGLGLMSYSLLTSYKFSLFKFFSYKMHLILDALASSAFLLLAVLHQGTLLSTVYCLVMGGGVIVVIALSNQQPISVSKAS